MLESAVEGLVRVVQWPAIGYLMAGILSGLYFGAVPGLSGLVGMAILLPFTFGIDPVAAFALLMGMFSVTTTSDTIASVLLGVPGTAGSQATILDGYPMARQGQAARAFGAAFTVSAVGGVLGAILLGLSLPVIRPLILSFASPEFFMLGVLGLTMVGTLSGDSMLKGLAVACLGVMVSTIGYSPQGGMPRYNFDIVYLFDDGLPIIPVVLGLFALPEVVLLAVRKTSISQVSQEEADEFGLMKGVGDAVREWWLVLRSCVIGMYIGILPGLGATIVDWVAYGHAVQSSRDKSRFGKGDVRGVIAPEAANNAMKGAALIPTVAFGIPGSATMAVLLGAFLIQGLSPGPTMLTTNLHITFSMVWTLVIANIVGSVLLMVWARQLTRITFIEGDLIVPAIVLFVFMGAWMAGNTMGDWTVLIIFGALGLIMRAAGWPRAPLVLGFVLGSIMETALDITHSSYGQWAWLLRPVTAIIGALALLTLVLTALGYVRRRRPRPEGADATVTDDVTAPNERLVSLPFALMLLVILSYAVVKAYDWQRLDNYFPHIFGYTGIALVFAALMVDLREFRKDLQAAAQSAVSVYARSVRQSGEAAGIVGMSTWFAAIFAGTYLVGQMIALPLFMLAYLRVRTAVTWRASVIYAVLGWALLYGMFDQVIHIVWYPSLLLF